MPLYWAGLWLAVNIAPGRSSRPLAKYSWSVEHSPITVTSAPRAAAPRAKARDSAGEEGRMSWPTTIAVGAGDLDEGGAEELGERLVPLVRHDAAYVVRLHDLRQIAATADPPEVACAAAGNYRRAHRQRGPSARDAYARSGRPQGRSGVRGAQHPQVAAARDLRGSAVAAPARCAGRAPAGGPPRGRRWRALRGRRRWARRAERRSASRTTSQPRGAVRRSECSAHRS